jgi:apolipoprotein N-acyltransferase
MPLPGAPVEPTSGGMRLLASSPTISTIAFADGGDLFFNFCHSGQSAIVRQRQNQIVETTTTTADKSSSGPLGWKKSLLWLALAVACFHAVYTSLKYPAAGLLIFGYALGLVQLTNQPTVRRAFYFGLAAGFLCYAPQLWFFWKIFSAAAMVLWLLLAFWIGVFAAIACGCIRQWGKAKAAWLIPIIWTGVEYFRSELYYLKFSWLNVGYALPHFFSGIGAIHVGIYAGGFLIFLFASAYPYRFVLRMNWLERFLAMPLFFIVMAAAFPTDYHSASRGSIPVAGVQMEFPNENAVSKMLDVALAKNTNACIFVLSEYTLDGPVPDSLKSWCREHSRFLVVGGKDPAGTNNFYDTAFVVGTNGDVVFKQGKRVPIQFFKDGLPATEQKIWNSPWGKIGFCVCYDLSYTRVTDELVRQGAQLLIVPTMDVEFWSRHEHELHARVAPVRAAEYGIPIFRLASSGISQAVAGDGTVVAQAPMPGNGAILTATLRLPVRGELPLDRLLAPFCAGVTALVAGILWLASWRGSRACRNTQTVAEKPDLDLKQRTPSDSVAASRQNAAK